MGYSVHLFLTAFHASRGGDQHGAASGSSSDASGSSSGATQKSKKQAVRKTAELKARSFMPVPRRGRCYAYLDAKITQPLLRHALEAAVPALAAPSHWTSGTPLVDLLPVSPAAINATLVAQRKRLREKYRVTASSRQRVRCARRRAGGRQRRKACERLARQRRLRRQAMREGAGRVRQDARVVSLETDGVGIRIALHTPAAVRVGPLPSPEEERRAFAEAAAKRKAVAAAKTARGRKAATLAAALAEASRPAPPESARRADTKPIFAALDLGRAKLFTAAVCQDAWRPPTSCRLTRKRYYAEMHHRRAVAWEQGRANAAPVAAALAALSTGDLGTSDPVAWRRYLDADALHREVLEREYVEEKERALWKMRLFRRKRGTLDRAVQRLMRQATRDARTGERLPRTRPLHLGVGDGQFGCTGPGERAVPTTSFGQALKRGAERQRRDERREVVLEDVDESYTTQKCCACGAQTTAPMVWDRVHGERRGSRRLRSCANCAPTTIGRRRDRDVQASRNILWLQMHKWAGAPRPAYLSQAG
jgi:hypothetical protein